MLKSGDHLFVGSVPIELLPDDPHASFEGRTGGVVLVVSAADGRKVAECSVESPVVWDGLAAANGKLFVSTETGQLQCWQGK